MAERITVNIPRNGLASGKSSVRIDISGMKGQGCSQLADRLVKSLDGAVVSDELKPEFYQSVATTELRTEQGGQ